MHLQIDDTGELEDVPPELGERIIDAMPNEILSEIESRMGVKIRGIDIQFTGSRDSGESS